MLKELYQELILDHGQFPRNCRELENPTHQAKGINPICGDKISIFVHVEDGVIKDVAFKGVGCAISTASASLLTERLKGMSIDEATGLAEQFRARLTQDEQTISDLGKLEALGGVRAYPSRVKCATLAWHALQAAFEDEEAALTVSTE